MTIYTVAGGTVAGASTIAHVQSGPAFPYTESALLEMPHGLYVDDRLFSSDELQRAVSVGFSFKHPMAVHLHLTPGSGIFDHRAKLLAKLKQIPYDHAYALLRDAYSELLAQKGQNKIAKLPALRPEGILKRRVRQPVFKLRLDRMEDVNLRLVGSLVTVGGRLFRVAEVVKTDGEFVCLVEDGDRTMYHIPYSHPELDLRTPEPQYFMDGDTPAFFWRHPARQQQQGVTDRTLVVKTVGQEAMRGVNTYQFLKGMQDTQQTVLWSPTYGDIMTKLKALRSLRLSPATAIYRLNSDLIVEYRGRPLGVLEENVVQTDAEDAARPWIVRDMQRIGLAVKAL